MKRFTSLIVAGLVGLTLISGTAFAGQEIKLLMEAVPDTFIIKDLLPEFEKETGIKVKFEIVNYAQMHAKLLPQLVSSKGSYDAIVVDNYWAGEFPAAGWLVPLDEYVEKTPAIDISAYLPSMLDMVGYWRGKLYMLPFYNYAMCLIYRTDMMEDPELQAEYQAQYGEPLSISRSVEDYVKLCKFMTREYKGKKIYGSSMQGLKPDPIVMEWSNYLFSLGGDYYNEKWHPIINNEASVESVKLYGENIAKGAPPGSPGYGFDEAYHMVAEGNAFSYITYNWMLPELNDVEKSKVAGKVDIEPMPGGIGLNGGWGWAIPNSSPDKEAAWKFISWVESFPIAKRRALIGGSPTRYDVFTSYDVVKKYPWYPKVMWIVGTAKPVPEFLYSTQMIEVVGRELSLAVGGKDPQAAMDDAAKELEELAKRAGIYVK